MATTLETLYSQADSGESVEDKRAYTESVLARTAVTHYDDDATQDDQFPFTD